MITLKSVPSTMRPAHTTDTTAILRPLADLVTAMEPRDLVKDYVQSAGRRHGRGAAGRRRQPHLGGVRGHVGMDEGRHHELTGGDSAGGERGPRL